jgi:hypothetical protein
MKILFVEDSPLVHMWIQKIKRCGPAQTGVTTCLVAQSERDALFALSTNSDIAFVLLDGTITQERGPRDTEIVQHEATRRGALVIAISSSHNEEMITDGAICGWDKLCVAELIMAGTLLKLSKELHQIPAAHMHA